MSTATTQNQREEVADDHPLSTLNFLVGDWSSEEITPAGLVIRRQITYRWIHGQHFLFAESLRETGDQVVAMNLSYLWDPLTQRIKVWVIGSDGSWNQSVADAEEDFVRLDTAGITAEGLPIFLSSTLTRTATDGARSESWTDIIVSGKHAPSPPPIIWHRQA